jgi:hypothetical protein
MNQFPPSPCVVDTGGRFRKSSIIKDLIIYFGHHLEVELTYRYIFAFRFTLKVLSSEMDPAEIRLIR